MIFIIGIDHQYQTGRGVDPDKLSDFKNDVKHLLAEEKVGVIAEEFSVEAARASNIIKSIPQELAENYGVLHILADPDRIERQALGIRSRQQTAESLGFRTPVYLPHEEEKINAHHRDADALREIEWLRRITPHIGNPMLFICGFNHVGTFSSLLKERGYDFVIYRNYEKP